tara:strand:- start:447 stop:1073 length:627 start_codon:yes stop_codon:yes gene_type:complete
MKKIFLFVLKVFNLKSLAIVRSLISYDKKGAQELSKNDNLEIYNEQKDYFKQLIETNYTDSLIDFGCGTGRYLEIYANFNLVHLVDISKENLKLASIKAEKLGIKYNIIRSSIFSLNSQVDIFFSVGVFGQFYQLDSKVLEKIHSLLSKNGKAVFTVKVKEQSDNEVLALSDQKIKNLFQDYNHKIHKKYFKGLGGKKYLFNVIELKK